MTEEQNILNEMDSNTATLEQETSENQPESAPLAEDAVTDLKKQLEESKNKFLYLMADFDNFKRHVARERIDMIQTAGRDVLSSLIPILDDFDRAAKNGGLSDGVTLIHHKLLSTVNAKGLRSLDTKIGDDFNADIHEAVVEIPAPADNLQGKVVDIIEQGYQLGERIVRFAKVVVGK